MRKILQIGAVSGLAAGVAIAAFTATVGRSPMRDALDLEESLTHDDGGVAHEDLFTRGVQEIGGALGLVVFGLALGIIYMIVWAATSRRLMSRSAMASAIQLGSLGFVSVVLVPFLKYPANPPAVGNPDTVNERTVQYLAVLAFSVLLVVLIWQLRERDRGSSVAKAWKTAIAYALGLLVIFLAMPSSPDAVEAPAELVWRFRLASIGSLAVGWTVLALVAGTLLTKLATQSGPPGDSTPDELDMRKERSSSAR